VPVSDALAVRGVVVVVELLARRVEVLAVIVLADAVLVRVRRPVLVPVLAHLERALMRRVDGVCTKHLQRPGHGVEASEEDRADEHARGGIVGGVLQHHANHRRREDLGRQVDPPHGGV